MLILAPVNCVLVVTMEWVGLEVSFIVSEGSNS